MKVLGLSAGRKLGNNEVLVKEAMMAAEEMGAEVGMIRLLDLDIKPCTGCLACFESLRRGGSGKCVLNDDFHFLDDQIMDCDAVILASPVFVLTPHGLIKVIADRMGPSHDVSFKMEARRYREEHHITTGEGPDERSFKKRVAGFICVGGSTSQYPVAMALPLMNLFTFSSHIQVIDQMLVLGTALFENAVLNPDALARARKLGRNIAEAAKKPGNEVEWKGDKAGTCPACHSNLLVVTEDVPVFCAVCGAQGEFATENGKVKVKFSEEELKKSRVNLVGKLQRWTELDKNLKKLPDKSLIPEKLKKYEGYREIKKK